ncbi:MAG TPA: hypothetical protein VFE59_44285 [Trebonia sp.]|nr:hypothetical protein [Trebonia sp.]
MNRLVIARRPASKCECTDATHMSNPLRKSSSQSTEPSGAMFSSVPCSRTMLDVIAASWIRCASIFLAAIDLPTPGMLVSVDSAIVVTSAGCPATALAAFS